LEYLIRDAAIEEVPRVTERDQTHTVLEGKKKTPDEKVRD